MINLVFKKAATKATAILVAGVAAVFLVACSADGVGQEHADAACAEMADYPVQPGAQSVVVVVDPSKSMRGGSWIGSSFDSLVTQAAGVYSTLSVVWVGGSGEIPVWAIDNLALNNEKYEFGTKHYDEAVERAASCVASMMGAPASTQPGTDLGTAIQVASDRLVEADGPKRLIVVSDGLSNTGPIDLTGVIATTAVDAVVSKLDVEGFRPDLMDVEVTFADLGVSSGSVNDGPTVTWLRNYWTAMCERSGAATCEAPVADQGATEVGTVARTDAPEDPDLALPSVQFEFSESEVRFLPKSTELTLEADAALSTVAACLQDGSTLTVVGHAANVGDPVDEQFVSGGRAQNVANRVLELAGHPNVIVNAFGVGSTEPKSASGHEPEDRRVDISLTGACD